MRVFNHCLEPSHNFILFVNWIKKEQSQMAKLRPAPKSTHQNLSFDTQDDYRGR